MRITAELEGKTGRVGPDMNKLAPWRCLLTVIRYRIQTKAAENSFLFFSGCITLRFTPGFDLIRSGCVKKIQEITNPH